MIDLTVPDDRLDLSLLINSTWFIKFSHITVCGDTHGQYFDLNNIFKLNGNPSSTNPYLFNGDFVDRGSWGLEVFITLLGWKLHDDKCMYLTRGNHEATVYYIYNRQLVFHQSSVVYYFEWFRPVLD